MENANDIHARDTLVDFNDDNICSRPTVLNMKSLSLDWDDRILDLFPSDPRSPSTSCDNCMFCNQQSAHSLFSSVGVNPNKALKFSEHLIKFGINSKCSKCWGWAFLISESLQYHSKMLGARIAEDSKVEIEMSRQKSRIFSKLEYKMV